MPPQLRQSDTESFLDINNRTHYSQLNSQLRRGDIIEIKKPIGRYNDFVFYEKTNRYGIWCYNLSTVPYETPSGLPPNRAQLKYEALEDMLRDPVDGGYALCRINNQSALARKLQQQSGITSPNMNDVFNRLDQCRDRVYT